MNVQRHSLRTLQEDLEPYLCSVNRKGALGSWAGLGGSGRRGSCEVLLDSAKGSKGKGMP